MKYNYQQVILLDRGQEKRRKYNDLQFNDERFDAHLSSCFKLESNIAYRNKPSGGLWTSSYWENDETGCISAWHSFCQENWGDYTEPSIRSDGLPPRKADINTRLSYLAILIQVKKDARIYMINSKQDYKDLYSLYPYEQPADATNLDFYKHQIDWMECKKNFDIVCLTTEGELYTRGSWQNDDMELYGWDCESSVMLNNVVESYKVIPSGVKPKSKQE